jgi:hypothetical protein
MSREVLLRVAGPALVIVLEVEAPTRLVPIVFSEGDEHALGRWLEASPLRTEIAAVAAVERDAGGGARRQDEWTRTLGADGGGIGSAVERLLEELHAAEARAREHHAGGRRPFERLRRLLGSSAGLG